MKFGKIWWNLDFPEFSRLCFSEFGENWWKLEKFGENWKIWSFWGHHFSPFLVIFADFTLKNTLFGRSLWRALQLTLRCACLRYCSFCFYSTQKQQQHRQVIERFVGELDCRLRMSGRSRIFLDFWQFLVIFADFTLKNTLFERSLWRAVQSNFLRRGYFTGLFVFVPTTKTQASEVTR